MLRGTAQQTEPADPAWDGDAFLVGRRRELAHVAAFLARVRADGDSLLVAGEAGAGKTALLDAAARLAAAAGFLVLRAGGTEFEASLNYAALNQALLPLHAEFAQVCPAYREALEVALGFGSGPAPDRLTVSNATVELLNWAAASRPVLLVVDDLPWLDGASAAVLGFVSRRLAGSRVGFLGALRSEQGTLFERAGLSELELAPLDEVSATALISARYPLLAAGVKKRLLAEAQGNPLALLELPAALTMTQRTADTKLPDVLPLGRRLQALFAARVWELPPRTRRILLLAALECTGEVRALTLAGSALDDLAAAERARLVSVGGSPLRLEFRHPLTRAAVVELATESERRAAHRELAGLWRDRPDRRAWHLAKAATGPDEGLARELARDPLTPKEREIAALAAEGLSNKQIAQRLYLSPKTVGNHLFRIFPKLGISSRAALRDALTALPAARPAR